MVGNERKCFKIPHRFLMRNLLGGSHYGQYKDYRKKSRMGGVKSKSLLDMSCISRLVIPKHMVTWEFQISSMDSGVIKHRKDVKMEFKEMVRESRRK